MLQLSTSFRQVQNKRHNLKLLPNRKWFLAGHRKVPVLHYGSASSEQSFNLQRQGKHQEEEAGNRSDRSYSHGLIAISLIFYCTVVELTQRNCVAFRANL